MVKFTSEGYLKENVPVELVYPDQFAVGPGVEVGHGANSQFGPTLPTLDPSGQSFASWVQAFGPTFPVPKT